MAVRIDPGLGVGPPGPAPGLLGTVESPLAQAGAATSRPFVLEGELVAVSGVETRGEHTVWLGGVPVLSNLTSDAGPCGNVVTAPATLRRELLGTGGSRLESTVVAPALPLVAVQWSSPKGGLGAGTFHLSFAVLPMERDLRYLTQGASLRAVPDDTHRPAVEATVHPTPSEWQVAEGPDGGLGVRVTVEGEGPVTLLVAAGDPEALNRAAAARPHMGAHEIRAAADADPENMESLRVATGVLDLDQGVAWTTLRVRGGLVRGGADGGEALFWCGMGALAAGDGPGARGALKALGDRGTAAVEWVLGGQAPVEALATLLTARYTLLTGDAGPARDRLISLPPEALAHHREYASASGWGVWCLALTALADALRHAADDAEIQRLREMAALPGLGAGVAGGSGLRLPMVGDAAARPSPGGALLGALLEGDATIAEGSGLDASSALGSWARMVAGDVEGGYQAWRSALGHGLAATAHQRASWDPPSRPPGSAPEAGRLLCALTHGLLGLAPDAPSGRIRVAPALPGHLTAFTAEQIQVGEARFSLSIRNEGATHTFALEPTQGRVPPLVVLEPSVAAAGLTAVRVDGVPADLEAIRQGHRIRVSVQLPLDGPRTLEIDAAE